MGEKLHWYEGNLIMVVNKMILSSYLVSGESKCENENKGATFAWAVRLSILT